MNIETMSAQELRQELYRVQASLTAAQTEIEGLKVRLTATEAAGLIMETKGFKASDEMMCVLFNEHNARVHQAAKGEEK